MKVAICAPFMQSDLWQERLRRAAPGSHLEFDEFYRPEDVRGVPRFHYDACVVAIAGASGLEAAIAARERNGHMPLLWLSDDDQFGLEAFRLRAVWLLGLDCSDGELKEAMGRVYERTSEPGSQYILSSQTDERGTAYGKAI